MTAKEFTKIIYDLCDEIDLKVTHHQMGDVLDAISKHPVRSHYVRLHLTICRLISLYDCTRSIFIEAFCRLVEEKSPLFEDDYSVMRTDKPKVGVLTNEPMELPDCTRWKMPKEPVPQSAVQGIVIDVTGDMLIMHRSDKVRSARNCWSFPSGLHDIGETQQACIIREVVEEYGLDVLDTHHVGIYENIAGDEGAAEQYHWNVTVMVVLVNDVRIAINKEPEKHDQMEFVGADVITSVLNRYEFHPSFSVWIHAHMADIMMGMKHLLSRYHRPYRTATYECGCELTTISPPEKCVQHDTPIVQVKELV